MKENQHFGTSFDAFLEEEGLAEKGSAIASKRGKRLAETLPRTEHERGTGGDQREADQVVPVQGLTKVKAREHNEDGQTQDLLYRLEFGQAVACREADPVGRYLECILE